MICTDRLRVKLKAKISEVEFPLVDFFPFIFVGYCIVRTFASADHLTAYFNFQLSCLSFSACVNGRDVRELDDLFVVLLLV